MNIHDLSAIERESIRKFVQQAAADGHLSGRVLDYGCGRQPYKAIVEAAGGEYVPWDDKGFIGGSVGTVGPDYPLEEPWDAILCTQVVEYVPNVSDLLSRFGAALSAISGALVMTYPTTWPELPGDLHRFTKLGMEKLLAAQSLIVMRHEMRAALPFDGFELPLGYGVVARP